MRLTRMEEIAFVMQTMVELRELINEDKILSVYNDLVAVSVSMVPTNASHHAASTTGNSRADGGGGTNAN